MIIRLGITETVQNSCSAETEMEKRNLINEQLLSYLNEQPQMGYPNVRSTLQPQDLTELRKLTHREING